MKEKNEKEILTILHEKQFTTVEELSKKLFISPATVRRSLSLLQEKGLVIRTHGGAKLNDTNNFLPNFNLRTHTNVLAKRKIALSAIKLIKNGDVIFLDSSTSSYMIAEYLKEFSNLKVITNGIDTLSLLAKNNIQGYSTGGVISADNKSTLVGQIAHETISRFHANIAFFSAQAMNKNGEIYDCFEQENYLRKVMMSNADVKVFLCDDNKIDHSSSFRLCSIKEIDYVISNYDLTNFLDEEFKDKIIKV